MVCKHVCGLELHASARASAGSLPVPVLKRLPLAAHKNQSLRLAVWQCARLAELCRMVDKLKVLPEKSEPSEI
jgi:hypothetical protein